MSDFYGSDIAVGENGEIMLEGNDFKIVYGIDTVLQGIKQRLFTPKGALFYDEKYGSNLHKFIHAGKTGLTVRNFKKEVASALEAEPLIDNKSIKVNLLDTCDYLKCYVSFDILGYDTKFNLVVSIDKELKIWSE